MKLPGSHNLSSTLIVAPGTTINAYGATLTWTAQTTGLSLGSGARVFRGTYVGPGGATYNATGLAFHCSGTRGVDGSRADLRQWSVDPRCHDQGLGRVWDLLEYCRKVWVLNNVIEAVGYAGIGGASVEDAWVERNKIDSVDGVGAPDTYGIYCDRHEDTEIRDPRSKRVRIAYNNVRNVPNWEGIDTHGGEDFEIVHNHIEECRFGIVVIGSDIDDVRELGAKRVKVAYNTIIGSTEGAAITLAGANDGDTINDYAEDCQITNNTIISGGIDNDSSEGSIRVYGTKRPLVEGNQLDKPRRIGINIVLENVDFTVQNNVVVDCCDDVYSAPAHIRVTAAPNNGAIIGNTSIYRDDGAAANVSVFSVDVAGSLTGLISRSGTISVSTGNQVATAR